MVAFQREAETNSLIFESNELEHYCAITTDSLSLRLISFALAPHLLLAIELKHFLA